MLWLFVQEILNCLEIDILKDQVKRPKKKGGGGGQRIGYIKKLYDKISS